MDTQTFVVGDLGFWNNVQQQNLKSVTRLLSNIFRM
jgi:hypothetical protein